jgi:hypothetical protein
MGGEVSGGLRRRVCEMDMGFLCLLKARGEAGDVAQGF